MFDIINERFHVGEQYRGRINGAILTVVQIQEPGKYHNATWNYDYTVPHTLVHFRDEKTGKLHTRSLEAAKRLLLDRIA